MAATYTRPMATAPTTPVDDSPISRVDRRQATVALVCALLPIILLAVCSAWLLLDLSPRLVPGDSSDDHSDHPAEDSNSAASRLAGGVLLSQSISCFLLLLPLLSDCCTSSFSERRTNEGIKVDFVRTISVHTSRAASVCLGVTGLTMVVIGLVFHSSKQDLSPIRLLIAGVVVTVLTCASLMASFWPFVEDSNNNVHINVHRNNSDTPEEEIIFSSSQDELNPLRASFSATELNESGASADPEGYRLLEDDDEYDDEEALVLQEARENDNDDNEEIASAQDEEEGEEADATTSTNRLRGTRRLLQLAAPQVLYLYAGCAILLVRLPFSLAIPHFVAST
jgi:hypothetical protein